MKDSCVKYLNEQFGGDADVVNEIYAEYVSSLKEKLGEAEAALQAEEWIKLDRAAHAIKGNALSAGDNETAEIAITLRNAAKLQERTEAAQLIARLRELLGEL